MKPLSYSAFSLSLPTQPLENGERCWEVRLPAGLHQLSVLAFHGDFPMETLYYSMQEFGNGGARTGPWDYKPMVGSPLMPSYWVYLDGQKLGLWVFARVSIPDLEAGVFRGRFAFRVRQDGVYRLRLVPYHEHANSAPWQRATLERDPVDTLMPLSEVSALLKRPPRMAEWPCADFWCRLPLTSFWRKTLERAVGWALDESRTAERDEAGRWKNLDDAGPMDMTAYLVGWRLFGLEKGREKALALLEELIALPGWGRPREDIYGWDGDLVAVDPFRACIQAYFGLDLEPDLKARVLEKLRYQGERFLTMALLTRDYWGGSVLQDHGWRAILGFAECAMLLSYELDEAREWLQWAIPRFRRALDAMPPDGHLPASSYGTPGLYVLPLARLRQVWLECTDEDLYDAAPVLPVVERLGAYVQLPDQVALLVASSLFFHQMAERSPGSQAKEWLAASVGLTDDVLQKSYFSFRWHAQGVIEGYLSYPGELPEAKGCVKRASVYHFEDAGLVMAESCQSGLKLQFQCGPWLGHHAYRKSDNACDRMLMQIGPGSFILNLGDEPLIVHPDSNYALRTDTRNSLLIGYRGQYGDVGYPMSLPSWKWRGEEIVALRNDAETGFFARLNLAPLYPDEAGVLEYYRDFILPADSGELVCRDQIVLRHPQPLEWRFHTLSKLGIEPVEGGGVCFAQQLGLTAFGEEGLRLQVAIRPTKVVYSYTGSGESFMHAAYLTEEPASVARVEFRFDVK